MDIKELAIKLGKLRDESKNGGCDREGLHIEADNLLLEYIGDKEITKIFNDMDIWYA